MSDQPTSPRVDRRLLLVGGGLGGVLLGLLLLMTVFGGGGGGAPAPAPPRPGTPAVPVTSVQEALAGSTTASLPVTGRDPFMPLVNVPNQPGSAQVTEPAQAEPPAPAAPTQTTVATGDAGSTPTEPVSPGSASLELQSITRNGSGAPLAQITVDGQSYSPAMGETFSYGYRLERIDGQCVEVSAAASRAQMCLPEAAP